MLSEAYKSAVERYGGADIRSYGVMLTDALSSHDATLRWGIDTYTYRQFNAWATVDTYEDILADVASAVRDGVLEARLPVPGFLRLNTNGGVTPPVLEGRVMYIAGDEVYEL